MENHPGKDKKQQQLDDHRVQHTDKPLTTNQGRTIANNRELLKVGERGPTLHEDWQYFEKITHFVHEEQPERVVHARGYSAHGEFEYYKSMKDVTRANFLGEAGKKTPLTIRFSTVQGPKGSYDTARDLRCQGVKLYTEEGNYDLTTIAMPVLINFDAMKFPDAMHAYQSKQDDDVPTATGAHDRFWDYVANNPEAVHMVTWIMSDRGVLRSYRHMESWSINTYTFVNEQGKATYVRFVWKPVLGVESLLQEEAIKIGGIDPDFHRKDLRDAIDRGAYPEYELGVQLIPVEDEDKYDVDILDPTKFWPEELIPVQIIGKMTLNRNIENYHTESEQVAFNPANVVPGIDFSNDPVLQGRLVAYHSAQLYRIGPNFQQLPINKPVCPFHNNQRRGPMRYLIDVDHVNYHPNSLADNTPHEVPVEEGGYEHYPKEVGGHTTRKRIDSVNDYFSQTRIFWNSLTSIEKMHTIEAFSYQLGNVMDESVRQQNVNLLANVDVELASTVADNIGVACPTGSHVPVSESYPSLSQYHTPPSAYTKKVGVLIGNGFNDREVTEVLEFFDQHKVFYDIISERLGYVTGANGLKIKVNKTFLTSGPYLVDSVYVVGGNTTNEKRFTENVTEFVNMAYKLYKPIGIATTGQAIVAPQGTDNLEGVILAANSQNFKQSFITAIAQSRFWNRDKGAGPGSLGMTGITK
ncbi:catalase [Oceanobacillus luteolus]|uniref:Catalase n=1 Tax=Oceanobacillus luteolus TaxID=1274358 RepID=A0ABW4HTL1_9BACI